MLMIIMKNYCDYDAIVHYAPGEFGLKYKTDLAGKLVETALDKSLREVDIHSFKDSYYRTFLTAEPVVLYRVYGQYQKNAVLDEETKLRGARLCGRYVSTEFAESVIDVKIRLALAPGWLNAKMYEAKLLVPKGIEISVGMVASVMLENGTVLPGGAEQILLPKDWPEEWVQGYRRITARQLQFPPRYRKQKPEEVSIGKDNLYPRICPLCGYERTRKLHDDERFDIVGIKGNRYTMKWKCMAPDCEYCW